MDCQRNKNRNKNTSFFGSTDTYPRLGYKKSNKFIYPFIERTYTFSVSSVRMPCMHSDVEIGTK